MGDDQEIQDLLLEDLGEGEKSDEEEEMEVDQLEDMLKYSSVKEIAHLMRSDRFVEHVTMIDELLQKEDATSKKSTVITPEEYDIIVAANKMLADINNEIKKVHKFLKDHYALKFPELEQLVLEPVVYAKVVKTLKNEMDPTNLQLGDILPPHTIMVVNVTASTTNGKPLSQEELEKVEEAADELIDLDEARQAILQYVQNRMGCVAPNLSAIVGTAIAAQLIGCAGGLDKLAALPSNVIQLLGKEKKTLTGFSAGTFATHAGFVVLCDLVKREVDVKMKAKVAHLVAGKVTLAARIDHNLRGTTAPDSKAGEKFREDIEKRIAKLKEPPPPKQEKPLPAPDDRPKKHRGGRKARAAKARYHVTDMAKFSNRIEFAGDDDEFVLQEGKSMGMLGKMGSGLVRLRPETKVKSKRAKTKHEAEMRKSSQPSSGLSSSLVFTPVQGMELVAPQPKKEENKSKYFSATAGFKTPVASTPASIWGSVVSNR
eukprot:TRINITY_DN66915_c5_g1_i1.p1 TRINITY_DN66915_c5_g1~~TRINITY_DN66915_c5_g1_i1.p1  ORF type:complete len:486 (+),score=84.42 TRINITY_DN66915_c5_g1_i1:38-1495(+)